MRRNILCGLRVIFCSNLAVAETPSYKKYETLFSAGGKKGPTGEKDRQTPGDHQIMTRILQMLFFGAKSAESRACTHFDLGRYFSTIGFLREGMSQRRDWKVKWLKDVSGNRLLFNATSAGRMGGERWTVAGILRRAKGRGHDAAKMQLTMENPGSRSRPKTIKFIRSGHTGMVRVSDSRTEALDGGISRVRRR